MGRRGAHSIVLKRPGRVHAFVLEEEVPLVHPGVLRHAAGVLQDGLAFADSHAFLQVGKGQQIVELPHAAETLRHVAHRPVLFDFLERFRDRQFVPLVRNIEQIPAFGARGQNFIDAECRAAVGINALLANVIGHDLALPVFRI